MFFAGGFTGSVWSNAVDIYDVTTNIWTTATLSVGRRGLAGAGSGNKIVFAGGQSGNNVFSTFIPMQLIFMT
jgi:hypothetical protein